MLYDLSASSSIVNPFTKKNMSDILKTNLIVSLSCLKSFTGCLRHLALKQSCYVAFKACNHLGTADLFTSAACSLHSGCSSLTSFPWMTSSVPAQEVYIGFSLPEIIMLSLHPWRHIATSSGSFLIIPIKLGSYCFSKSTWPSPCIEHTAICSYILVSLHLYACLLFQK